MTNKINLVINLSILALLIYLAVSVHKLNEKVFPDPKIMIPLSEKNITDDEMETFIKNFLVRKLSEIE
jgi:hypothetical protein